VSARMDMGTSFRLGAASQRVIGLASWRGLGPWCRAACNLGVRRALMNSLGAISASASRAIGRR